MRILFLTSAHNSLSQRAFVELSDRGHEVAVALALSDEAMLEAAARHEPDLILAPMLKRVIPEAIWRTQLCIIVHPGIVGDRGSSSLDWAIHTGARSWGVTLIEAIDEIDAGPIWSAQTFPMRPTSKSALYRHEVTEAALRGILEVVERVEAGNFSAEPLNYKRYGVRGMLRPAMRQHVRAIEWDAHTTSAILRKIQAADSAPGVLDSLFDSEYYLYGVHEEETLKGPPGSILAQRHGAICRATIDGAVWITHLKARLSGNEPSIKLPAALVLGDLLKDVPQAPMPAHGRSWREIRYRERNSVGYLHFDLYNGAMSTQQCERLRKAVAWAGQRPTGVLVLMGGADFWSNGINLNVIEAARDPAAESWRNINAINDVVYELLTNRSQLVISALQGNAAAGGVMLALAADYVYARQGVVLNPHYKSMGLYGSEYWTYSLPRRVGAMTALELTESCLPLSSARACSLGLIDDAFGCDLASFRQELVARAETLAQHQKLPELLAEKCRIRDRDERFKPLAVYREQELARMWQNFYGPDQTYHEARRRFVFKVPAVKTEVADSIPLEQF